MSREHRLLPPADPREAGALRAALLRGGYTDRALVQLCGPISLPKRTGRDMAHFLRLTRGGEPLHTLIRLFLLGVPVEREAARGALEPPLLEKCGAWGLLESRDSLVEPLVKILPFRDLLLVVDQPELPGTGTRPDQVLGITAATATLANYTVRRPVGRTLDLGAGCGIQALLAARHSREVIGADVNARALEFARFNAALNGLPVCFLHGSAFEPVQGRRFDLIVSVPPFMISPSARYTYRDSGFEADQFCRMLVRQAPGFLEERGLFQLVCDFAQSAGQNWEESIAGRFEETGCDVWVMRVDQCDPASYARIWIGETEQGDAQECGRLYNEWVAYYERVGIEGIATALVTMRRASRRRNWLRTEVAPEELAGPFGDHIALGFELRDYLEQTGDAALLEEKLRLSPDARLHQTSAADGGRWRPASSEIRLARGVPYAGNIDPYVAGLVARCDGRRPLRDLVVHLAVELGTGAERLAGECLPLVRGLIERGFLLPAQLGADVSGRR